MHQPFDRLLIPTYLDHSFSNVRIEATYCESHPLCALKNLSAASSDAEHLDSTRYTKYKAGISAPTTSKYLAKLNILLSSSRAFFGFGRESPF